MGIDSPLIMVSLIKLGIIHVLSLGRINNNEVVMSPQGRSPWLSQGEALGGMIQEKRPSIGYTNLLYRLPYLPMKPPLILIS